jgi:hypothetical protein
MDAWSDNRHSRTNDPRDDIVAGVDGSDVVRKIDSDTQTALPESATQVRFAQPGLGLGCGCRAGLRV